VVGLLYLSENNDLLAAELLLKLLNQAALLDHLLVQRKLGYWDEDQHSLLAASNIDLLKASSERAGFGNDTVPPTLAEQI
jgi:hypothetical protein